jgi:hypothetical protein
MLGFHGVLLPRLAIPGIAFGVMRGFRATFSSELWKRVRPCRSRLAGNIDETEVVVT